MFNVTNRGSKNSIFLKNMWVGYNYKYQPVCSSNSDYFQLTSKYRVDNVHWICMHASFVKNRLIDDPITVF